MLTKISEQVITKHPILFIFIVGLFLSGLLHIYMNFALADELKQSEIKLSAEQKETNKKVDSVLVLLQSSFAELRLREITREVDQIEDLIKQGAANSRDKTDLSDLKAESKKIVRELKDLKDSAKK